MGTNYYAREVICEKCGNHDEVHIGKSSAGWSFTFHATEDIKSLKDWDEYICDRNARIFDEYGKEHTCKEFLELVENKKDGLKHAEQCSDDSYLDGEGNSMSPHEFS